MDQFEGDVVAEIRRLFTERGGSLYGGEAVTQLEHALQAAHMAETEGASDSTIAAALLHDIGHLLHELDDDAPDQGIDDVHEELADRWLTDHFPTSVTEPIRLHVAAKRYLCTVEPEYMEQLSEPSLVSLRLQGGQLNEQEVSEFEQHELFNEVVHVRRLDDRAKIVDMKTPDLDHFMEFVSRCTLDSNATEVSS